ncbi:TPA: TrbI/VirB10 family protein, partial [Neisseria gonorrhoeae]
EVDQEAEQIRQAKAQMFQAALAAPTKVDVVASTSRGSSGLYTAALSSSGSGTPNRSEMLAQIAEVQRMSENAGSNPAEVERVYNQQLANAQQMAAAGGQDGVQGAGGMPGLNTPPTPGNIPRQTAQNGGNNWRLESQVERPNAYMIRSGAVIPATLISGINSDLPGMVQAQISQNVYDTATGRHLLLPQGSRLVGTYSSGINLGQRRLFIAWNRIIFPDGKALDIGDMPGASGAGYAGFSDRINNHYGRLWGNALMLSLVGASITYGVDKNSNNNNNGNNNGNNSTVRGALSESLGQTFGQAVSQSIQKNMNVSPTLEIRPGYRFNVILTKDIDFSKPYRSFDY